MDAERLTRILASHGPLVIAVSGGVDSMTLATIAHRAHPETTQMVHAVSPAVPAHATLRVRAYAECEGWTLRITDAGEFADPRYRANPVDRCYFCKTNLYGRIRSLTDRVIASGTNVDDLGDFRPGLRAAAETDVVHPYVEAGIDKAAIRALARGLSLFDLAELPAQPCLASRIETGIAVDADDLAFVDQVERRLSAQVPVGATVRCRVTRAGIAVELGEESLNRGELLGALASELCATTGRRFLGVRPYRTGSAFLTT
ncbi:MAG TPA: adenine nucleotide alpha hydrolase [Xanthobacteraceae bacterium]|nr:adenine nucleotide alpha hydrolase [Xanthobacteraceae bacterium]